MYQPSDKIIEQCRRAFTYHPPHGNQAERYTSIRSHAFLMAKTLLSDCPESRELSIALTKLEEAVFWANASIARNEPNAATNPVPAPIGQDHRLHG